VEQFKRGCSEKNGQLHTEQSEKEKRDKGGQLCHCHLKRAKEVSRCLRRGVKAANRLNGENQAVWPLCLKTGQKKIIGNPKTISNKEGHGLKTKKDQKFKGARKKGKTGRGPEIQEGARGFFLRL